MNKEDIDKVVKFTREPKDFIHVWEYQKEQLDDIMRDVEGLETYSDCIGFLIREYQIKKEFYADTTDNK